MDDGSIHPKVGAAGKAGVAITAIVGLLSLVGVIVPEDVSDAALTAFVAGTTVVTFIAGYWKRA